MPLFASSTVSLLSDRQCTRLLRRKGSATKAFANYGARGMSPDVLEAAKVVATKDVARAQVSQMVEPQQPTTGVAAVPNDGPGMDTLPQVFPWDGSGNTACR